MKPRATNVRTLGLGVLALGAAIGLGARWQPDAAGGEVQDRGTLRKQVVRLRAELDLLQVEHEAARNTLLQFLKEEGARDLRQAADLAKLKSEFTELNSMIALVPLLSDDEKNKKTQEMLEQVRQEFGGERASLLASILKSGAGSNVPAERLARMELDDIRKNLATKIESKKRQFLESARRLAETRLDLAELEASYNLQK